MKHIYVMRRRGSTECKIGVTKDIDKRQKQIQSVHGVPIDVVALSHPREDAEKLESLWKQWLNFRGKKLCGDEMYRLTDRYINILFNGEMYKNRDSQLKYKVKRLV